MSKTIWQLDPVLRINLTDKIEISQSDSPTSESKYGTMQQLVDDIILPVVQTSAFITNVYVTSYGSDTNGNGSITNPYATIAYAQSKITDASPTKQYNIVLTAAMYTEDTLELNPFIHIVGNNALLNISNSVVLGSGWSNDFATSDFITHYSSQYLIKAPSLSLDLTGCPDQKYFIEFDSIKDFNLNTFTIVGTPGLTDPPVCRTNIWKSIDAPLSIFVTDFFVEINSHVYIQNFSISESMGATYPSQAILSACMVLGVFSVNNSSAFLVGCDLSNVNPVLNDGLLYATPGQIGAPAISNNGIYLIPNQSQSRQEMGLLSSEFTFTSGDQQLENPMPAVINLDYTVDGNTITLADPSLYNGISYGQGILVRNIGSGSQSIYTFGGGGVGDFVLKSFPGTVYRLLPRDLGYDSGGSWLVVPEPYTTTYTPTITNIAGISLISLVSAHYTRVNNGLIVGVQVSVTATDSTIQFALNLPEELVVTANCVTPMGGWLTTPSPNVGDGNPVSVIADDTNNYIVVTANASVGSGSKIIPISFMVNA